MHPLRGILTLTLTKSLEQIQNNAACPRLALYATTITSASSLVKSLGWDTLEHRRLFNQSVLL